MGLPILYFEGHSSAFPNYGVFLSLGIFFTLTNSVDPDEMPPYVVFHLGLSTRLTRTLNYIVYSS